MKIPKQETGELAIEFRLVAEELTPPTLLDTTSFLYDFNLLYEVGRLATDPRYDGFHFSRYVYFRNGRPLRDTDRLLVRELRQESPLLLIAEIAAAGGAAAGAIWAVTQTIERISNWRFNREKLKQELEKLRRENEAAKRPALVIEEEQATVRLSQREALPVLDQVGERFAGSAVQVRELEITVVRRVTRRPHGG